MIPSTRFTTFRLRSKFIPIEATYGFRHSHASGMDVHQQEAVSSSHKPYQVNPFHLSQAITLTFEESLPYDISPWWWKLQEGEDYLTIVLYK